MNDKLFTPVTLGKLTLANRVVMAPMTRSRAIGNVPNDLMEKFYAERADAGLIITEGVAPSADGLGYARIPGLFTDEQELGWKRVTDGVHRGGGRIFVQLMHTGPRRPPGEPAGRRADRRALGRRRARPDVDGRRRHAAPPRARRRWTRPTIAKAIGEFAARRAAGARRRFRRHRAARGQRLPDRPVPQHGLQPAHGPLGRQRREPHPLRGGGREGRRGGDRRRIAWALRISPYGVFNGMAPDAEMDALYLRLVEEMNAIGIAYIHVVDHSSMGAPEVSPSAARRRSARRSRAATSCPAATTRARADGRPRGRSRRPGRLRPALHLEPGPRAPAAEGHRRSRPPIPTTFYTPGERGYTDYPLADAA